jgi:hypothetical protein
VPFSICNYTVGALTRLPLLPFFLGTVVGCVPANVLWVSMGAAARAGHDLSRTKPRWRPPLNRARMLFARIPFLSTVTTRFTHPKPTQPTHSRFSRCAGVLAAGTDRPPVVYGVLGCGSGRGY